MRNFQLFCSGLFAIPIHLEFPKKWAKGTIDVFDHPVAPQGTISRAHKLAYAGRIRARISAAYGTYAGVYAVLMRGLCAYGPLCGGLCGGLCGFFIPMQIALVQHSSKGKPPQ